MLMGSSTFDDSFCFVKYEAVLDLQSQILINNSLFYFILFYFILFLSPYFKMNIK